MLIIGDAICKRCGKNVKWCYKIPNDYAEKRVEFDIIPSGVIGLKNKPQKIEDQLYKMTFSCPQCWFTNDFEYISKQELR